MNQNKNSKIAKLARINESVGNIHFDAVQDEDSSEWLVRIGIVRIVHSISEEEAKEIAEIMNASIANGARHIISKNSSEITTLIESITEKKQE
jgi:hypothetical protein